MIPEIPSDSVVAESTMTTTTNNNHASSATTLITSNTVSQALSSLKVYNLSSFVNQISGIQFMDVSSSSSSSTSATQPPQEQHLTNPLSLLFFSNVDSTTPTTTLKNEEQEIDLATLSTRFTLLIQIRRYTRHGACGFCTRRQVLMAQMYKSLLQLGILPIVIHAESKEEANEFFDHFKNPLVAHMLRVSDPEYVHVSKLVQASSQVCLPIRFIDMKDMGTWETMPYMKATNEGYQFNQDSTKELAKNSNLLMPKFLLVKGKEVIYEWNQSLGDEAPEVFRDVLLHFPNLGHVNLLEECNESSQPFHRLKSIPRYNKDPKSLDFSLVTKDQQEKELQTSIKNDSHIQEKDYKTLFSTLKDENRAATLCKVANHICKKFLNNENGLYSVTELYSELKKKAEKVTSLFSDPQYFENDDCANLFHEIEQELLASVFPAMYVRFTQSWPKKENCSLQ
ncbi:hypothetical protein FDP41_011357 [Naegleria fowleri]|uniref:Uncharacterized protein n=1 Tax=Naegleria fowleri TaxID=5763 RepID=A0A6A5BYQ7_NAEFO|nr:uncharacterized protein FDP41_011357 [Naegleria fowleri]KAF0982427.1 hypothetical protein FDP41_011357 [Naegleria fowleri]CAG4714963.1 unnamed protein product [Naegleria fowleri]